MASKDIPEEQFQDHGKVCQNAALMKLLNPSGDYAEKVLFSCAINKKNKYMFNQERTLLITNKNVYNIDKKKI